MRNSDCAEPGRCSSASRSAAQLALYGLPDDYFTTFVPKILTLDEHAVTRAAEAHIDPSRLLTVIVGDREKVAPSLSRLELGAAAELSAEG